MKFKRFLTSPATWIVAGTAWFCVMLLVSLLGGCASGTATIEREARNVAGLAAGINKDLDDAKATGEVGPAAEPFRELRAGEVVRDRGVGGEGAGIGPEGAGLDTVVGNTADPGSVAGDLWRRGFRPVEDGRAWVARGSGGAGDQPDTGAGEDAGEVRRGATGRLPAGPEDVAAGGSRKSIQQDVLQGVPGGAQEDQDQEGTLMDNLSLFFLDVWTFAFSQVGILAIGFLGGYLWGAKVKAKVETVIGK